jgi:tetratricopeptide (TPR) repeat protein
MQNNFIWSGQHGLRGWSPRRRADALLGRFRAAPLLPAVLVLTLGGGTVSVAVAESASIAVPDGAKTPSNTDTYLARLRTALPQSWLQREFQRQRSFPAFAHSRQLVAKGKNEEAFQELEGYLASDPDDLVIQFGYLILATELKRYRAAISAADQILASLPEFAPALFYRGLARAALGEDKEALPDLAAAVDSNALAVLSDGSRGKPGHGRCARALGARGGQFESGADTAASQRSGLGTSRP